MSLTRQDLFDDRSKIDVAIERFRFYEPLALKMDPRGFFVADSGGKDSDVIVELAKMSGVKFEAHFHPTTVDPPEVLRHLRRTRPDTIFDKPATTMWKLIEKKKMPPTRICRYCCSTLKEYAGKGRFIVTGVRWAESRNRAGRPMVDGCQKPNAKKKFLHPIIDWTKKDVWDFHALRELPYCSLYDEGFKRVGCIGCPMSGPKGMARDFERWPNTKRLYIKAFQAACDARANSDKYEGQHAVWTNGQAMFDWWMNDKSKLDPKKPSLFD